MSFDKQVGEFRVSVSSPYPYWISIIHEYSHGETKFEHTQLDDLIYALQRAQGHIATSLAANRAARAFGFSEAQADKKTSEGEQNG